MRESPSRYGGIAAMFVLGIGLMLVGNTWGGLCVLGICTFVSIFALCPSVRGKVLTAAIGALMCSGVVAYFAASDELAGEAFYQIGIRSGVTVTREKEPAKFHEVTNVKWGTSILFLILSVGGFAFYRKLQD